MPEPSRSRPLYSILRTLCFCIALPLVYLGGAGGAFFFRHYARAGQSPHLPLAEMPRRDTRLLVFSPHIDDETLGCAGLIQQTLKAGGQVRIVFLTNGDGFRTAVERQVRSLRVGPTDYIQFAQLRQQESYRALGALGVEKKDVLFLGYPDAGLLSLWNSHWTPDSPYTSGYTRCSRSPYANTADPKSVYCGRDLTQDIRDAITAFRPTLVTVTHPAEDHGDHSAAADFVANALREVQADPAEALWASRTALKYYLVHRGDWPLPQGRRLDAGLSPPNEMEYVDTRWTSLPLTHAETKAKLGSIDLYESQTALMGRFLESFARRNELFGTIAAVHLATVPDGVMKMDADLKDWESLPPALLDPVRDNVLRDLQGSGDIRALYVCRDSKNLYLRLDTRQPVSGRMRYTFRLRAFGTRGETANSVLTISLRPTGAALRGGVHAAAKGRVLELAVPWDRLAREAQEHAPTTLAVSADTVLAGITVDKTGARFLDM